MTRVQIERLSSEHQAAVRRQLEGDEPAEKRRKPSAFGYEYDSPLEMDFAHELQGRKLARNIFDWRYHSMIFRIAPGKIYTPDFLSAQVSTCDWADHLTIYEVKGSWNSKNARDSRTRLEVCADRNQWFTWKAVTRENGIWRYETI